MSDTLRETDGVSVHAGFPNPATDKSLHTLDFNKLLISHSSSTFMFRISGDNWQDIGIFSGDIAVVDRALDPRKIDLVIWWNEDSGEFSISHYTAMPKQASCWGVVTSTIRQLRRGDA